MTEMALPVPPRCFYKRAQTWPYCWSKAYLQKDISHDRCTCYMP